MYGWIPIISTQLTFFYRILGGSFCFAAQVSPKRLGNRLVSDESIEEKREKVFFTWKDFGIFRSIVEIQCDQNGRFLKILCAKVSFKISSNVRWLFRLFESITFQAKTAVASFWATFGKVWATFIFNIWSHCVEWPKNMTNASSIIDVRHSRRLLLLSKIIEHIWCWSTKDNL